MWKKRTLKARGRTIGRRARLGVEAMEERGLMTTWGIAWPVPQALTISFAPDGTSVAGQQSQLFRSLDGELGAGNWESPLLKAVQTWASNANINVGLVGDGGEPIGSPGPAQGDPRFGDIRISAAPLAPGVVATTAPYDPSLGTYAGDVILNSNYDFNPNDSNGYDLYTVMLHEAGHVFGFADSSDPTNFMSNVYNGPVTGLAPGAVPALQALYGAPTASPSVGSTGNTSMAKATPLPNPPAGLSTLTASANLVSPQDQDFYSFQSPKTVATNGIDVAIMTGGISLLTPSLTVLDASGHLVATSSASGPMDGGTTVHLASIVPGAKYYVEVAGATGDALSVGAYQLSINLNSANASTTLGKATPIQEPGGYTGSVPLVASGSIASASVVTTDSFKAPAAVPNGFNVQLGQWGVGLTSPSIQVSNAAGQVVGSAVSTDPTVQTLTVHVDGVTPGATYFVQLLDGIKSGLGAGSYQIQVSFNSTAQGSTVVPMTLPLLATGKGPATNNTTIGQPATLQALAAPASNPRYATLGTLSASATQTFYQVAAPKLAPGQSSFMTVTVEALQVGGLDSWATVFDDKNNPVSALCLGHEGGTVVLQVPVSPLVANYKVEVSAAVPGGPNASGDFYLGVQIGAVGATSQTLASGTLTAPLPLPQPVGFTSDQSRYYRFVLGATSTNPTPGLAVLATITDANGNVVATATAQANEAASLTVFLAPGTYSIAITPVNQATGSTTPLSWTLTDEALSDPIRPYAYTGSGSSTSTLPQ